MNHVLQYYLHDEPDAFRLKLSGRLSGEGAQSVQQAWQTALSIIGARQLIVDMTFVNEADERGRVLLRLWHHNGARIIAASPESCALAESIVGETLPQPPAAKPGFFERVAGIFRWFSAGAALSADAGARHARSASTTKRTIEIAAVAGRRGLDCRMP